MKKNEIKNFLDKELYFVLQNGSVVPYHTRVVEVCTDLIYDKLEKYAKLLELSNQELLLLAGEMTSGELRTVRAVLKNRMEAIRKMTI